MRERKEGRKEQKKVQRPFSRPHHEVVLGKEQSGSSVTTKHEQEQRHGKLKEYDAGIQIEVSFVGGHTAIRLHQL